MTRTSLIALLLLVGLACNPFAPRFDDSPANGLSILGDAHTVDGLFQNLKYAYTFRDTTIYGQMMGSNYTYVYRDYDIGGDVSWGRDEDLRITNSLFQTVQRLDLIWNSIVAISDDSSSTHASVSRNFNLTVAFNPSDIIRVDGYVTLSLTRPRSDAVWQIVRWRDESNF